MADQSTQKLRYVNIVDDSSNTANKQVIERVQFVDADGNPVTVGTGGGGTGNAPLATPTRPGLVKPGSGLTVSTDGTLSVSQDYDPIIVGNGPPAIAGHAGQDYLDADTGDLYTFGNHNNNND